MMTTSITSSIHIGGRQRQSINFSQTESFEENRTKLRKSFINSGHTVQIISSSALTNKDIILLSKENISDKALPSVLLGYNITFMNSDFHAIGLKNINGGVELYCPMLQSTPFSYGKHGLTILHFTPGILSKRCYLFADFMDYLAFASLKDTQKWYKNGDAIIVNSPDNYVESLIESDVYEEVYSAFPNTEYGRYLFLTLKQRNQKTVNMMSENAFSPNIRELLKVFYNDNSTHNDSQNVNYEK